MAAILRELQEQKLAEEYSEQLNHWAFLAAIIVNSIRGLASMFSKRKPKLVSSDDFINKDFKKLFNVTFRTKNEFDKHIKDAKAKGLNGPWGGEGD